MGLYVSIKAVEECTEESRVGMCNQAQARSVIVLCKRALWRVPWHRRSQDERLLARQFHNVAVVPGSHFTHGCRATDSPRRSLNSNSTVVLIFAMTCAMAVISAHRHRRRCELEDLLGSTDEWLDEWCERNWPQEIFSSSRSSIAGSSVQTTQEDDEGGALRKQEELNDELAHRLCTYVNFADFFANFYHVKDSQVVVEQAAALMNEALSWRTKVSTKEDSNQEHNWLAALPSFLSRSRRESQNATLNTEIPEIEFTWIEAPRARALALVCIAPREKLAVVAVRGSVNVRNFMMAFKVWPRLETYSEQDNGVSLHSGFAEIADEIFEKILPLLDKDLTIHITGHSMGGAVSTILALRLRRRGYDIAQVVAFGMPLVIWRGKEEDPMTELPHNIPLLRVEHPLDPVVHFPAPARVLGLPVDITKVSQPSQPGAYYPVGRRMSIGSRETLPKRASNPLDMNRGVMAHRLRSYSAQCSLMAHPVVV